MSCRSTWAPKGRNYHPLKEQRGPKLFIYANKVAKVRMFDVKSADEKGKRADEIHALCSCDAHLIKRKVRTISFCILFNLSGRHERSASGIKLELDRAPGAF